MGRNEVLKYGQTFSKACLNWQFDCTTGWVAHQTTHTAQLADLVHATTGAGVSHHPNWVVRFHYVFNERFHLASGILPNVDNGLVTFVFCQETFVKVIFDCDNFEFSSFQNSLLLAWDVHIEHTCCKTTDCGVLVTKCLYVVQHDCCWACATKFEALFNNLGELLFAYQVSLGVGNHICCQSHWDTQCFAFESVFSNDFWIGDVWIVLFSRTIYVVVVDCLAENHTTNCCPNLFAIFKRDVNNCVQSDVFCNVSFVSFVKAVVVLTLAQNCNFFFSQSALVTSFVVEFDDFGCKFHVTTDCCEVVAAQNHVLCWRNNGFTVGKLQDVVCSKHQVASFCLCLYRKRYVNSHLVAVEVGVECSTCKWVQFDSTAFDKYWFKCLDGKSVQCWRTVEHYWVVFDYVFKDIPNFCISAFNAFLCRFNVVALTNFHKLFHYKWFEQFQSHFLWNTALVQFEFWTYYDNGTAGVVNTLTKKVLTETTLLTTEQTRQGLEFAVTSTCLWALGTRVVQQAINSILKHTFFVVDQDFWSVDFDKSLQTIVTVDNSAVQIVEVACCISTTIKWYHCTEFWWKNRQNCQNHPFGAVATLTEGFNNVQTLDSANFLCACACFCKDIAEIFCFRFQIDVLQKFTNGFGTCASTEVLCCVFACGSLCFAVFVHGQNLLVLHTTLHWIDNYVTLEVNELFQYFWRHIEDKAHTRWSTSKVPNVGYRSSKFDVTHTFTTNLCFCNFYATLFANNTLVADAFVLTAVAFPVFDRSKNLFAEKTVFFWFLCAVVDSFGFFNFAVGPLTDFFRGSNADLNHCEVVDNACTSQRVGTQSGNRLSCNYFVTHNFVYLPC